MDALVTNSAVPLPLSELHMGAQGIVVGVRNDSAGLGDETGATVVMRLIELGFVPGERVEVIAESLPLYALIARVLKPGWKGDPMAVRIGGTCFALRRREASAVMVSVTDP